MLITTKDQLDMIQLWQTHVSLMREVILGKVFDTRNTREAEMFLEKNQNEIGENLGKFYNKRQGKKYAKLLLRHIAISVKIIDAVIRDKNTTDLIYYWYKNAKTIAKFLHKVDCRIEFKKTKKLLYSHLNSTLDEFYYVKKHNFCQGEKEYEKCLESVEKFVLYVLFEIN